MTRISRAVLLREAMDDLLKKHRVVWSRALSHGVSSRNSHRAGIKSRIPKQRRDCRKPIRT